MTYNTERSPSRCNRAYSPEMVLTNTHKGREFHSCKGLSKEGREMLFLLLQYALS